MPRDGSAPVAAAPRRGTGIRTRLVLLALALVVPVLGFAGLATWRFAEAQRNTLERVLLGRTGTLGRVLDAEIASLALALRSIAATASFQDGELDRVRRHMAALAAELDGNLTLRDATGRLLLHSGFGPDVPLPDMPPPPGWREIAEGREARLADLIEGRPSGEPVYAVWLPARDAAGQVLLLGAGFRTQRLVDLLRREVPEPGWTAALVDRNNRVVARSQRPEALVGRDAGTRFASHVDQVWRATNPDGVAVVAATVRAASGWTAGISLPAAEADAPLRTTLRALIGLGALMLAGALLLAWLFARRIARAIWGLSAAADSLGRGLPVPRLRSALREVNQVAAVLSGAAATIAARDAALREREAQLAQTQRLARVGGFEILVTPGAGPDGGPALRNIRSPNTSPCTAWGRRPRTSRTGPGSSASIRRTARG